NAIRFDLALFLGVGRYAKASAATLAEARLKAARLAAEHPNGRRALIYAIDASGRSALVTDDVPTQAKEPAMKTYAKKFNAQRAAKAAGHDPEEIEIVKTKGGFAWRLKKQAGGQNDARDPRLAPDPSPEPQHAIAAKRERPLGKRAQIEADARAGRLPEPPDFSAETHK